MSDTLSGLSLDDINTSHDKGGDEHFTNKHSLVLSDFLEDDDSFKLEKTGDSDIESDKKSEALSVALDEDNLKDSRELTKDVNKLQKSEVQSLLKKLAGQSNETHKYRNESAALRLENEKLKSQIEELTRQNESYKSKIEELTKEKESILNKQVDAKDTQIKKLQKEISEKTKLIKESVSAIDALEKQVKQLKEQRQTEQKEIIEKVKQETQQVVEKLKKEKNDLEEKLEKQKTEISTESTKKLLEQIRLSKQRKREFDHLLVEKLKKRVDLLKEIVSPVKDEEPLVTKKPKKDSLMIGDLLKEMKALILKVNKKFKLYKSQNKELKEEIMKSPPVKQIPTSEHIGAVFEESNQKKELLVKQLQSDLQIYNTNDLNQHIDQLKKLVDCNTKLEDFVYELSEQVLEGKAGTNAELGVVTLKKKKVIDLHDLFSKIMVLRSYAHYKEFYNEVKREMLSEESNSAYKDRIKQLISKYGAENFVFSPFQSSLSIEEKSEIIKLFQALFKVQSSYEIKQKMDELFVKSKKYKAQADILQKLKSLFNVKHSSDVISQCQSTVEQLRKYVKIFPKFQSVIQDLCKMLNVDGVEEILPAIKKLIVLTKGIREWVHDVPPTKDYNL